LDRNVKVIFIAGLLSAFLLGVFEILFPFYLDYRGFSLVDMGLVFSFSTLAISFIRIFLGECADVYGRKKIYLTSCTCSIASKSFFPLTVGRMEILANKFLNDLGDSLRNSVHNIMLYESASKAYTKLFSWFTASNFILQASGNLALAVFLAYLGYSGIFFLLAGVELAIFLIILSYREGKRGKTERRMSLREAYSFKIDRNLKVLASSVAIGVLGFGIAHSPVLLPLYFKDKYGLDIAQISIITAVHRLSFMSTPLADKTIRRLGLKTTYIFSTLAYALSFLAVGLVTFPIVVFVPIFLIHDLFGGGIRMTASSVIVQNLAADGRRGREVNTYEAIQMPMAIMAPSIAGILASSSWDLLFIVGGLLFLVSVSVFSLFFKANIAAAQQTRQF